MKQILIMGRGGQGAVTSSQVLAIAAFNDGKHTLAFPNFGVERMGAPVKSYCRIDDKVINLREQVYEADYAIILDPTLSRHFNEKVSKLVILNSSKTEKEACIETTSKVKCVDITAIAIKIMGKPFVNIAALGALAALTDEVSLLGLEGAIKQQMGSKGSAVEKNIAAVREVYNIAKQKK
ncbi:MAG: 2-oxoacid:acceptor oxidoreductase family protein [Candidatus Diapherotrites archaeon]|nr:2-oxoacid:acceptor oxidoreductase family protein [Candidatus Diapherotrites archaeon]